MKKYLCLSAILILIVGGLCITDACKKTSLPFKVLSPKIDSFSFKGHTYTDTSGRSTPLNVVKDSSGSNGGACLTITFPNIPGMNPTAGIYRVESVSTAFNAPPGNICYIIMTQTIGSKTYFSTGGNGSNQNVSVSISDSIVVVSGNNIEMVNQTNQSDSSGLDFNVKNIN